MSRKKHKVINTVKSQERNINNQNTELSKTVSLSHRVLVFVFINVTTSLNLNPSKTVKELVQLNLR